MRKNTIFIIMAALVLSLAGCKKEGVKVTMTFDVELDNSHPKDALGAKVYLDDTNKPHWENNDPIHVNDGEGTVVPEDGNKTRGRFTADITEPQDNHYYAVYPASIASGIDLHSTQHVELPRVQQYKLNNGKQTINAPMFAYNPAKPVLRFHNLCGLMKITITNDKAWDMVLDSIQVEATTKKLSGTMSIIDITSDEPYVQAVTHTVDSFNVADRNMNCISLVGINKYLRSTLLENLSSGNPDAPTSITLYVYLPTIAETDIASNRFYIRAFTHPAWETFSDGFVPDKEVRISYEMRQASSTYAYVKRNSITPVNISLSACKPTFTSLKPFTVDTNGTKVSLSRGNAQYYIKTYTYTNDNVANNSTSTGEWRFAPRQWDFLKTTQLRDVDYHAGMWVEHFTWNSGDQPVLHYVFELHGLTQGSWSHVNDETDFPGNNPFVDWGTNFRQSGWRSLTQPELNYLLYVRTTVKNDNKWNFGWLALGNAVSPSTTRHADTLYGIIVFPDGFHGDTREYAKNEQAIGLGTNFALKAYTNGDNLSGAGDIVGRHRNDNKMTVAQFEFLEAQGCVFIPCIGSILATGDSHELWSDAEPQCDVWTSTVGSTDHQARILILTAHTPAWLGGTTGRAACHTTDDALDYRQFNVRLVRPYHENGADYKYDPFQ